jgi:hypothetical protein
VRSPSVLKLPVRSRTSVVKKIIFEMSAEPSLQRSEPVRHRRCTHASVAAVQTASESLLEVSDHARARRGVRYESAV